MGGHQAALDLDHYEAGGSNPAYPDSRIEYRKDANDWALWQMLFDLYVGVTVAYCPGESGTLA